MRRRRGSPHISRSRSKQSELLDAIVAAFAPLQPAGAAPKPTRGAVRGTGRRGRCACSSRRTTPPTSGWSSRILEQRGHSVVVAPNGREAVARAAEQAFDVVLMDVQMPEMDGLEATVRHTRARTRDRQARPHRRDDRARDDRRSRAMPAAGMDAYVPKPLRPDELLAAIDARDRCCFEHRVHVRRRQLPTPPDGTRDLDRDDAPGLLRRERQAARGSHRRVSLRQPGARGHDSAKPIGRQDAAALAAAAHQLKGSVGTVRAEGRLRLGASSRARGEGWTAE